MAKIPPPAPRKGAPPKEAEPVFANLEKNDPNTLKPLNFKVPADFHREFKTYAAARSISMVDLLRRGFELVKKEYGS